MKNIEKMVTPKTWSNHAQVIQETLKKDFQNQANNEALKRLTQK